MNTMMDEKAYSTGALRAPHAPMNPLYVSIEDSRNLVFSLPIIAENNDLSTEESDKQAEEYRNLIQTAVNNFDPLVKALEDLLTAIGGNLFYSTKHEQEAARAVLDEVKKGEH